MSSTIPASEMVESVQLILDNAGHHEAAQNVVSLAARHDQMQLALVNLLVAIRNHLEGDEQHLDIEAEFGLIEKVAAALSAPIDEGYRHEHY